MPLRVLLGYSDATVTEETAHPKAAEYPHRNLKGTPTRSNHNGTAICETYVAVLGESGCVKKQSLRQISFEDIII